MNLESRQEFQSSRIEQVVDLAAQGDIDKEIAVKLGISEHTVETYWRRLREKLNVPNRTSAVIAHLRLRSEEQSEQLRRANVALQCLHQTNHNHMTDLLADTQKRLAKLEGQEQKLCFFERATRVAHVMAYELASPNPVRHRFISSSAELLGLDVNAILQMEHTFYDHVYPDDLPLVYEQSLGIQWLPHERYVFLYRILMPEPRWILDTHQALYDKAENLLGIVGMAMDVHDMVLAGAILPVVKRITIADS